MVAHETSQALPLVFFPGAGGRVENLAPIATLLSPRRPTVLCAYPGLGGEPPTPGLTSLSDLQGYLLAALPERFDLVSMSMGGVLALRIALDHPARVRKLVLLATSGGVDVASLGALDWRENLRRLKPDAPAYFVDDRTDVTARLREITQPALLIYGDRDLIAPVSVGEMLARHLPSARLEVIAGADHDLELEHPVLIASFIEAHLRRP